MSWMKHAQSLLATVKNNLREWRKARRIRAAQKSGLQLGRDVRFTGRFKFSQFPYLLRIGNHVTIADDVTFLNHDGGTYVFRDLPEWRGRNVNSFGKIDIRDNCFIGAHSILMPNVTIGPNAVVGAGSVVNRDVPPNSVYAGVPARFICTYQEYVQKKIDQMLPLDAWVAHKMRQVPGLSPRQAERQVLIEHFWGSEGEESKTLHETPPHREVSRVCGA